MSNVLVAYATTDGQTATIAERIASVLVEAGHDASLVDVQEQRPELSPGAFHAVVVAASLHHGTHQSAAERFVRDHRDALAPLPSAFVSVSLTAAKGTVEARETLEGIATDFFERTGWEADETRFVAGALRYSEYGPLTRFVLKHIARREGGDTDTSRDYEYTDWKELDQFVEAFAREI